MAEQIALIESLVLEVTGDRTPPVLEQIADYALMGTRVRACLTAESDAVYILIGKRKFTVSLLELSATAALAVDQHLKQEIIARVRAERETPSSGDQLAAHHFGDTRREH